MKFTIMILTLFLFWTAGLYAQADWFEITAISNYQWPWGLFVIDMDGDEDLDLITARGGNDEIAWWENDGDQQFFEHKIDSLWDGAVEVHAGDLDGDGDMDILGAAYRDDQVAWYENDGNMNFTKNILVSGYDGAHFVRMFDVDGDNDMDIVACAFYEGDISWWENTGYPNFTRHVIDNSFDGCRQIDVSDLDNDGDADVLAAAEYIDQIAWYENNGNQIFQKNVIEAYYSGFWAKPFDFNNDNAWDILACASGYAGEDDISWFENDGSMNFSRHVIDGSISDPQSVDAADFDMDGDLDIVAATRYADGICWWENSGNTTFTKYLLSHGMEYAASVSAIDLDRDGDKDIVGSAYYTHNYKWWQNLTILIPGYVEGIITDNYGSPVQDVFVDPLVVNIHDYSDPLGHYELGLPAGVFDISFQKPGYYDYVSHGISVTTGDTVTLDVEIEEIPMGFIAGSVVDEFAVPLESVYVLVENTEFDDSTDENGNYSIELVTGTYNVILSKPGYFDTIIPDVEVTLDDTVFNNTIMHLEMPPIVGTVLNRQPAPAGSVLVSVLNTPVSYYSHPNGYFILEGVPRGEYDISFQHRFYFDTTIADVVVEPGPGTVLNVVLESKSAITGFVGDLSSNPLPNVRVAAGITALSSYSDSSGHYLLQLIPERIYSIKYSSANFISQTVPNIVVAMEETLVMNSVYLEPYDSSEVITWVGNPDFSPITAPIGATIQVDVYVQTAPNLNFNFFHLPLGTNDQYIVDHHSVEEGILYYPLTEWDDVEFLTPSILSPGWHNQSLLAFADLWGPPNPYLSCLEPTLIASFALEVAYDSSIIGDTVNCLIDGYDMAHGNGVPLFGDSTGVIPYYPYMFFSPLYFTGPVSGGCEYVVGDVNQSGDYNGLDVTYGVLYFKGGPVPPYECECTPGDTWYVSGDVNSSCNYNGIDITYGVAFFKGGPAPTPCGDCPPAEISTGGGRKPDKLRK